MVLNSISRSRSRLDSSRSRAWPPKPGVVMLIYLDHALAEVKAKCQAEGRELTRADVAQAIMVGAVERVRPKMMTVVAIMAGLLPICGAPVRARR